MEIRKDDAHSVPNNWPSKLRMQLEYSGSHHDIFSKLGIQRATIGIFETYARVTLPNGLPPLMKVIGPSGRLELEKILIGPEGTSKELAGNSVVAVMLSCKLLTGYEITARNILKIIRICTQEVLASEALRHDILVAAKTAARFEHLKLFPGIELIEKFVIDSSGIEDNRSLKNSDRPIDWASSHWWSGE